MGEKRVTQQTASDEIYNDDWFLKDSVLYGTKKVQPSVIKEYVNQGMATSQDLADEATARQNMDSQLASGISKQMSNLADFYDTTKSYVIGDVCVLQSGELMRCIAPTSGSFDNTKWESVTVDELFDDLNFSADAISYDNTSSGLEAENVQDAIDEVLETAGKVDDIVSHGQSLVENKISDLSSLTAVGTASGDIATFPDGSDLPMPKLEVGIEPVQDLHGYDAPWVGGAGKNKLQISATSQTLNGVTFTVNSDGTINTSNTATGTFSYTLFSGSLTFAQDVIINGCPENGSLSSYALTINNGATTEVGSGITITANTEITAIAIRIANGTNMNGKVFKPMIRLASVSDATFAPYSNICPISGWSEANVGVSGVNVWDEEWRNGAYLIETGAYIVTPDRICNKNPIPVRPNTQYNFYLGSDTTGSGAHDVLFLDADKNFIGAKTPRTKGGKITTPENCHFINFCCWSSYGATYNNDISINYPSTDTSYHAYNGHTYTIDLDGTRYGGSLDVVSGVMTVTHGYVDLGSLNWSAISAQNGVFGATVNGLKTYSYGDTPDMLCSAYKVAPSSYNDPYISANGIIWTYVGVSALRVKDTAYSDATAFTTAMSGVQLVYELATPQTIQLTPTQVKSLQGINNVWADCGAILDAEYIRDLTAIIDYILEQLGN